MRIVKLTARNFNGADFDFDLKPVTIITGSNFAGKSAVPNVARLALSGSLPPPLGVKGIYRLAGNPDQPGSMTVAALMDNGRKSELTWTRDVKGKISCDGGVSADLLMPPMLINPRSFWAKTGAERVQAIFESCPGADWDLFKNIMGRLGETPIMPLKVFLPVLDELQKRTAAAFKDAMPREAAELLLDVFKTGAAENAAAVKTHTATMASLQVPTTKPADVSVELETARQELAKFQIKQGSDKAKLEERIVSLQGSLDAWSRKYQQTPVGHLAEFINNEAATVAKDLRMLKPSQPTDDLEEEWQEAISDEQNAANENHRLAEVVSRLQAEIGNLTIQDHCPVCLTKSANWKDRALKSLNTALDKARAELGAATAAFAAAKATAERLRGALASIRKTAKDTATHRTALLEEATTLEADRDAVLSLLAEQAEAKAALAKCGAVDSTLPARQQALRERVAALETQQLLHIGYDATMKRREQLENDYTAANVRAVAMKAAAVIVVEEQRKVGEAAFTAVLKTARYFTDGILNSPLEFINGDLGRRVSDKDQSRPGLVAPVGSWITHETFSDSEQRIAYVGFSVAMAAEAPVKLVIIDEMATLEPNRKVQFVDRLIQLVRKGIIDQAICLEPTASSYEAFAGEAEVKLIRL